MLRGYLRRHQVEGPSTRLAYRRAPEETCRIGPLFCRILRTNPPKPTHPPHKPGSPHSGIRSNHTIRTDSRTLHEPGYRPQPPKKCSDAQQKQAADPNPSIGKRKTSECKPYAPRSPCPIRVHPTPRQPHNRQSHTRRPANRTIGNRTSRRTERGRPRNGQLCNGNEKPATHRPNHPNGTPRQSPETKHPSCPALRQNPLHRNAAV